MFVETDGAVLTRFHADGFVENHGDDRPKGRADDDRLKVATVELRHRVENRQN